MIIIRNELFKSHAWLSKNSGNRQSRQESSIRWFIMLHSTDSLFEEIIEIYRCNICFNLIHPNLDIMAHYIQVSYLASMVYMTLIMTKYCLILSSFSTTGSTLLLFCRKGLVTTRIVVITELSNLSRVKHQCIIVSIQKQNVF